MTIGIGVFGSQAGRAVWEAWAAAERLGTGSIGGFAVFSFIGADGEPVSLTGQRGGLASFRQRWEEDASFVRMMNATVAAVITSGPDRPEPLSQFLAASRAGLVTGHRLPNTKGSSGMAVNIEALRLIEAGSDAAEAVERTLAANPEVDAGLIAVTRTRVAGGNTRLVSRRSDIGIALIATATRGVAVLHNSIESAKPLASDVARTAFEYLVGAPGKEP